MLTAGANPWYVASQLGHEDVEMVFRTYGKFIREDCLGLRCQPNSLKPPQDSKISVFFAFMSHNETLF